MLWTGIAQSGTEAMARGPRTREHGGQCILSTRSLFPRMEMMRSSLVSLQVSDRTAGICLCFHFRVARAALARASPGR